MCLEVAVFLGSDRPLNRITQQQVVSRITGEPLNPTGLRKILVNSEELNILKVASGYVKIAIGRSTMLLMGKRTHYVDWAMASIAM